VWPIHLNFLLMLCVQHQYSYSEQFWLCVYN
jgi:hypothetical protein